MISNGEYTASELVYMARLKKIERDHKSIGATLDKRILYKIEEPKLPVKDEKNLKRNTLMQSNTTTNNLDGTVDAGLNVDPLQITKKLSAGNIQLNDFENEELMWKTKSGTANYSVKRKFDSPELQEFLDNFTADQKEEYLRRCKEALFKLSRKYRDEMNDMKTEMNKSGMFHPDANTHRAHCLYLTKLYKA